MNIRLASVRDIEGIARVHVESWKSTYNGIISESFLSNLTVEKRTKNWKVISTILLKMESSMLLKIWEASGALFMAGRAGSPILNTMRSCMPFTY